MALVVICNECGQPIDTATAYVTGTIADVTLNENGTPVQGTLTRLDWHNEHAPEIQPIPPPPVLDHREG